MKTRCTIWSVASVALGFVMPHGHAQAQTPGCVVMEIPVEDRLAFTQKLPPAVDKGAKAKNSKQLVQQRPTDPVIGSPNSFDDGQHRSDAGADFSVRERSFALGQNLADFCKHKIETETK